ncbi:MAG TPA: sigma-70 family RNA polymerase sigma factor [Polyangiaceae bacterium]|nr:sigma-70 family RNA polymerase sigma factor [Polyangiaceae bacterium]
MPEPSPLEPHTDLVLRAGRGDRSAATSLCLRFAPAVRAFARRRVLHTEAVDEFTQDVMLILVEALTTAKLEHPERLPGFVLGICKNLARDRARQRERRTALHEEYGTALAGLTPEVSEKPTYEIMHLEDCLSSLSERARQLVRLAYAESKSPADIAQALSLTDGNLRVLRHRTLGALRDCMSRRISWEAA